jgi:hypothetical protein
VWDERKLDVQIYFKDPLAVDAGAAAIFEIKNPSLFVSAESMQSLSPDKAVVVKTMPK